jgi:hypothetical protein
LACFIIGTVAPAGRVPHIAAAASTPNVVTSRLFVIPSSSYQAYESRT